METPEREEITCASCGWVVYMVDLYLPVLGEYVGCEACGEPYSPNDHDMLDLGDEQSIADAKAILARFRA